MLRDLYQGHFAVNLFVNYYRHCINGIWTKDTHDSCVIYSQTPYKLIIWLNFVLKITKADNTATISVIDYFPKIVRTYSVWVFPQNNYWWSS